MARDKQVKRPKLQGVATIPRTTLLSRVAASNLKPGPGRDGRAGYERVVFIVGYRFAGASDPRLENQAWAMSESEGLWSWIT
ncbi:MAG: hypothetical protein WBD08_11680, partial [Candidatus Acidiferrales bacterium]